MFKVNLIALMLLFKVSYANTNYEKVCKNHSDFKSAVISKSQEIKNLDFDSLRKKNLILIGETHFEHLNKLKIYSYLIENYFKGRENKSCLFLESGGPGTNPLIFEPGGDEVILKGHSFTWYKSVKLDGHNEDYEGNALGTWNKVSYDAYLAGVKVYPIDLYGEETGMNERNKFMAENINELYANGTCEYGVTINGFAHLAGQNLSHYTYKKNGSQSQSTYHDGRTELVESYDKILLSAGYNTIQFYLEKNISYSSVRLLEGSLGDKSNFDGFWNLTHNRTELLCFDQSGANKEVNEFVFLEKTHIPWYPLYSSTYQPSDINNGQNWGNYKDFDYLILFPIMNF